MPAVVRVGDKCSGHGDFPPRPAIAGSPNVTLNDLSVVRVGDAFASHCDDDSCHTGVASSGSPNITCNDMAVFRVGDSVSCGSSGAEGSDNGFAN